MTKFPIQLFTPPLEYYCIWSNAFTPDECDHIIQLGELLEFDKGRVGGTMEESVLDTETRDTDVTWVHPNPKNEWMFHRFSQIVSKANFDKFQTDLDCFDGFQYSKYKPGQHYDWHTDPMNNPPDPNLHRKLSMSLMLTDPKDYEGGELLLALGGNNEKPTTLKRDRGDLIIFQSYLPHKVVPVTSGERVALVTWALGPKPR